MTGPARVVLDPVGAHLEPGEILVAPSTDPGWTPLFLTAGGLVMEMGGSNSHGAVVAREYGIPAVVGVPDATPQIETGQLVTVDGAAGLVSVVPRKLGDSPGRDFGATTPRIQASHTTDPAARPELGVSAIERGEHPLGHLVDRAEAVHLDQQAARPVDLEQRRGLLGVDLQPDPDGVLVVVGAALDLGPLEQPGDDLVDVGDQRDHRVERRAGLGERRRPGSRPGRPYAGSRRAGSRPRSRARPAARPRSRW